MRELVLSFTEDPEWLPSVSQDITDAIHAELADVNADPELRASTYASTDSVLRLIVDLSRTGRPPSEALPPPAAVDYAREFVRRGLPLDSLLRAYHIGQATFFRRWTAKAHETITDPHELTEAVELGANWTFDYVEKLSDGLVQRYGEERERWVRSAAAVRAQVIDALLAGEHCRPRAGQPPPRLRARPQSSCLRDLERRPARPRRYRVGDDRAGRTPARVLARHGRAAARAPRASVPSWMDRVACATITSSVSSTRTSTFSRFQPCSQRSARLGSASRASPAAIARRFTPAESRS